MSASGGDGGAAATATATAEAPIMIDVDAGRRRREDEHEHGQHDQDEGEDEDSVSGRASSFSNTPASSITTSSSGGTTTQLWVQSTISTSSNSSVSTLSTGGSLTSSSTSQGGRKRAAISAAASSKGKGKKRASTGAAGAGRARAPVNLVIEACDVDDEELDRLLWVHVPLQPFMRRVKAPAPNPHRSVLWDYGVLYETLDDEDENFATGMIWYCLATEKCRDNGTHAAAYTNTKTNCTDHLKYHHDIISSRSAKKQQKKEAVIKATRVATAERATMVATGGDGGGHRHDMLKYVKNIVIGTFQTFNYAEHELVRQHYRSIAPGFPVESLHHKSVRHLIAELFSATQDRVKAELREVIDRQLPGLSISVDIWEEKYCSKKFLGLRVRWIDELWQTVSRLSALRGFAPGSALRDSEQLSKLVFLWAEACLFCRFHVRQRQRREAVLHGRGLHGLALGVVRAALV